MAERIEWFDFTAVAGTLKSAPAEFGMVFQVGGIERLDLVIPDGHAGLTGIRFNSAHQAVIPITAGSFIVGNNVERSYPLVGYPDHGNWTVSVYNTDVYDHMFHVAVLLREVTTAAQAPVRIIAPAAPGAGAPPVLGGGTVQIGTYPILSGV